MKAVKTMPKIRAQVHRAGQLRRPGQLQARIDVCSTTPSIFQVGLDSLHELLEIALRIALTPHGQRLYAVRTTQLIARPYDDRDQYDLRAILAVLVQELLDLRDICLGKRLKVFPPHLVADLEDHLCLARSEVLFEVYFFRVFPVMRANAVSRMITVEELDDLLQLAGNDLCTMGNQLVRLWH